MVLASPPPGAASCPPLGLLDGPTLYLPYSLTFISLCPSFWLAGAMYCLSPSPWTARSCSISCHTCSRLRFYFRQSSTEKSFLSFSLSDWYSCWYRSSESPVTLWPWSFEFRRPPRSLAWLDSFLALSRRSSIFNPLESSMMTSLGLWLPGCDRGLFCLAVDDLSDRP